MPDEFKYDVFLSHSAKDKAVVRAVADRLRADGLRVWFDEWEIKSGNSTPEKIEKIIAEGLASKNARCILAPVGPLNIHAIPNSPDSIGRRMGGQLPSSTGLSFPRRHTGGGRGEHQDRHTGVAEGGSRGSRRVQD